MNNRSEVNWTELEWRTVVQWMCMQQFFSNCVLRWEYCIVISLVFLYNLTHGFFTWSGLVFYVFCVVCSMLFYSSMPWYNPLCYCILSQCDCILLWYRTVHCYLLFCVVVLVMCVYLTVYIVQGGSNMTGTNCDLFTHNQSRSYLNHLVH
jgi:hypothetical protein